MVFARTTPAPDQSKTWSKKRIGLFAFLGVITLLVAHRGTSELALMRESGSDPQMPIWIIFILLKLVYWLLAGVVVVGLSFFERPRWRMLMGVVLLLAWCYAIQTETLRVQLQQQALTEARDSSTSPARLEQLLLLSDNQVGGYELDNRIASNTQTTPEILRKLYERHNLGTLMILARRPDTPEDVLQAIVDRELARVNQDFENEWIRKALKQNLTLPEGIRQKLDGHGQPPHP